MRLTFNDMHVTMPWDEIDAVVFDVGNVLLDFSPKKVIADILPEHPELHQTLVNKIIRTPYWLMLDHGTISYDEAVEAMAGRDVALRPLIRRVMDEWIDLKNPIAEGVAALRKCKAMGKKLYVLSNYHDSAFDYVWNKYDFFRLFDGLVVSARVKMLKPDQNIYRHLTEKFGLITERVLFIDDSPANIESALETGWQGVCYNQEGVLRQFFELDP